jgi:hypothetical protein
MTDDTTTLVFLTDGSPCSWLGPYLPGDLAIAKGTQWLREAHPGAEVYAVRANGLEGAKAAYRRQVADREVTP